MPEEKGYSDAYYGMSGRPQTTLWVPVYDDGEWIGTVFGDVLLTKYYSTNVFTFYDGEGRTYLFNGSDGRWILKSLGPDGLPKIQEDIYALLVESGNSSEDIEDFVHAVDMRQTGTAVLNFNGNQSYLCFMPLSSSSDWYIVTVIPEKVLLKESTQVQRMIQLLMPDAALYQSTYDGKVFSVPLTFTGFGFLWNAALLEEHGLTVPENQSEFMMVCEKLKSDGILPYGANKGYSLTVPAMCKGFAKLYGSSDQQERIEALNRGETEVGFYMSEGFEFLEMMIERGYLDPQQAINATPSRKTFSC